MLLHWLAQKNVLYLKTSCKMYPFHYWTKSYTPRNREYFITLPLPHRYCHPSLLRTYHEIRPNAFSPENPAFELNRPRHCTLSQKVGLHIVTVSAVLFCPLMANQYIKSPLTFMVGWSLPTFNKTQVLSFKCRNGDSVF